MSSVITTLFGLFGGLAMFLYGMNSMSEALQKAAGERMKSILGFLTRNPFMGALAGALVTAILQSSSATTVMVIGFVSAGLMGLPQAISVIFGANIGTTMTAQLIAFDISDYIYPILFVGFMINFISKKEKVKNIGMVIFSFGLLFEGIQIMSSVMKPLAASPIFTHLMAKVSDIPVLGILLGLVMTLVVQSSSATIAVLQSFASQPAADGISSAIGLAGAIPILLGDNIGTTITALLASVGQSRNAKRTAVAHSIFNISGSILFSFIIPLFAGFVRMISPKGPEIQVISRQIANAHTCFNIAMTIIWLPLIGLMVKIVMTLIPEKQGDAMEASVPMYLDRKMLNQPVPALYLVSQEIRRCLDNVEELFHLTRVELRGVPEKGEKSLALTEKTFAQAYQDTKVIQKSIIDYLSEMFTVGSLSQEQSEQASGLMAVINDIDRVSDRLHDIVLSSETAEQEGNMFSKDAVKELAVCVNAAESMFRKAAAMLERHEADADGGAEIIQKAKNKLRKSGKQFSKAHFARVRAGVCSEAMTPIYSDILSNMDRIADNCVSISEETLDNVRLLNPEDLGLGMKAEA